MMVQQAQQVVHEPEPQPEPMMHVAESAFFVSEEDPQPLPQPVILPVAQTWSDPSNALKVRVQMVEVVDSFLLKSNKNQCSMQDQNNKQH
jgi:hypothetical protein